MIINHKKLNQTPKKIYEIVLLAMHCAPPFFLNGHCVTNRQQVKLSNNIRLSKNSDKNWKFTGSLCFQLLEQSEH